MNETTDKQRQKERKRKQEREREIEIDIERDTHTHTHKVLQQILYNNLRCDLDEIGMLTKRYTRQMELLLLQSLFFACRKKLECKIYKREKHPVRACPPEQFLGCPSCDVLLLGPLLPLLMACSKFPPCQCRSCEDAARDVNFSRYSEDLSLLQWVLSGGWFFNQLAQQALQYPRPSSLLSTSSLHDISQSARTRDIASASRFTRSVW